MSLPKLYSEIEFVAEIQFSNEYSEEMYRYLLSGIVICIIIRV